MFPGRARFWGPGNTYLYSYQTYPSACVKATLSVMRFQKLRCSQPGSRAGLPRFSERECETESKGASAREGARVEVSEEDDQHGGVAIEERRSSGLGMF